MADEEVTMPDVATIVAAVVAKTVPHVVEREVAKQMDGALDGLFAVLDEGVMDDVKATVARVYGLHAARVAAELGVGMAEYAKIAREVKGEG